MMDRQQRTHLMQLESEAIFIMREVAAQFERPVLLFSGGKDSIVMVELARRAFCPAAACPSRWCTSTPATTSPKRLTFRDDLVERYRRAADRRATCRTRSTRAASSRRTGPNASRNGLQTVTLLDAIAEFRFDAAWAAPAATRKRRAPRNASSPTAIDFGQWDPKNQRPELWNLFNGRKHLGEHFRVFPLSNWTELDIWQYIRARERAAPVTLLRPPARGALPQRRAPGRAPMSSPSSGERVSEVRQVRFRTIGDITCTGAVESAAATVDDIIAEVASARVTERAARADDQRAETAMEDRKREGYF